MTEDIVTEYVEETLNPETFDVLEYAANRPVMHDTVEVYMDVDKAARLSELLTERREILAVRREAEKFGDYKSLSITDEDEDTEVDDEINTLVEELQKTALTFHIHSLAPALIRAIEKHHIATKPKNATAEELERAQTVMTSEILAKAIGDVVRGDGAVSSTEWTGEKLLAFEDNVFVEQFDQLVTALHNIVYAGRVFEDALTVDF